MSEEGSRIDLVGIDRETSRRNFLKTAAWATAAVSAAGVGGFGVAARYANAQTDQAYKSYQGLGDEAILQFAYLLELLEGTFYAEGVKAGIFGESAVAQIAEIRDHEFAHAEAIAATLGDLGAEVPATPDFTYPAKVFGDPAAFLELAATFEPVGIGAYQGAAPALKSKDILAAAISIHNAECQHRCAINILSDVVPPNNLAFEEALPLPKVQAAVKPFGVPV
jgi:hypothetical protein